MADRTAKKAEAGRRGVQPRLLGAPALGDGVGRPDVGDGAEARHAPHHLLVGGVWRHVLCRRRDPAPAAASEAVPRRPFAA